MNNKLAVLKIITWSVIALFLTCIFVAIAVFDNFSDGSIFHLGGNEEYAKSIKKTEVDAQNIENISMKWTYGSVYLSSYDGNKIIIDDKSNKNIDFDGVFKITEEDGTLNIEQPRKVWNFNFLWFNNEIRVLEIKVPKKQYNVINARFTSGKFEVSDITANNFDFKMTSGKIETNNLKSTDFILDITSGDVDVNGTFESINTKATSGSITINTTVAPQDLNVNITSGHTTIGMPDNDGFSLYKVKTSGVFRSDFDLNDKDEYKNGSRNYTVRMTSGKVELLKR